MIFKYESNQNGIESIRRSINHLPGYQLVEAVVEVKPSKIPVNVPIVIGIEYIQATNYMSKLKK